MKVYRPKYKDGNGKIKLYSRYRIDFIDGKEIRRRLPAFSSKKESEKAGEMIQWLMSSTGRTLDPELQRWLEQIPKAMRDGLAAFGLLSDAQGAAGKPLDGQLDDWRESLLAKGTTAKQADLVRGRAGRVFDTCGFKVWTDIVATDVESYLKTERDKHHISQQTSNFYVRAVKQFCRWMIDNKRAAESPVAHLRSMTVTDEQGRRALTQDDRTALLRTTAAADVVCGMTGHERYLLYKTALETGLRGKELRSLTVSSFDFDDLTVTVKAAYSKNKREDTLPIRPDTANELKAFFGGKMPAYKAFDLPNADKMTRFFHRDREAAGIKYVVDGKRADFHALRHTFITEIVRGGATIKEAQTLARHQTATLTIGIYAHAHLNDTRKVIERLQTVEAKAIKTGTDDKRNTTHKGDGMPVVCLNSAQHRISVDNHRQSRGKGQAKKETLRPTDKGKKPRFSHREGGKNRMAEVNGNRTHPGPYRPNDGFEDRGQHQSPVTSA